MIRATALAVSLCASSAMAQDLPSIIHADDLEIEASSEGYFAQIVYDNGAEQMSRNGEFALVHEGYAFRVNVKVTNGPEIIRIDCPPEFMALPDYAEVADGEIFVFQIVRAMF